MTGGDVGWLANPDMVRSPKDGSCGRAETRINSLFCKPICKPDAARQLETGETDPTERDGTGPVRRGHYVRERLPGTSETNVVWLITQRSRVQIPPPLPRPEALSRQRKGLLHLVCARICARAPAQPAPWPALCWRHLRAHTSSLPVYRPGSSGRVGWVSRDGPFRAGFGHDVPARV